MDGIMKQTIEISTILKSIFHFWEDDLKLEQFIRLMTRYEIFTLISKKQIMLLNLMIYLIIS